MSTAPVWSWLSAGNAHCRAGMISSQCETRRLDSRRGWRKPRSTVLAAFAVCVAVAASAADSDLARAVAARPRDPRLHNAYGIELQRSGRAAEAAAHFRTALDLDPHYADAACN